MIEGRVCVACGDAAPNNAETMPEHSPRLLVLRCPGSLRPTVVGLVITPEEQRRARKRSLQRQLDAALAKLAAAEGTSVDSKHASARGAARTRAEKIRVIVAFIERELAELEAASKESAA